MTTTAIPSAATTPLGAGRSGIPAAPADSDGRAFAITSFVLGIASILCGWTFVAPIVGLSLGVIALRRGTTERGLALWGVWLNGVILALSALAVTIILSLIGFGILSAAWLPFAL